MKLLRICVIAVFLVTLALFGHSVSGQLAADKTVPVITMDSDIIRVSINATDEELLQGVTAYDEKDGDISSRLLVESISRFIEPGVSNITYAVCDNDNHVSSATRRVCYEDYTPPRFTLRGPLVFSQSSVNILNRIGAVDVFDGDISSKVIITATDYDSQLNGTYQVSAKVSNSLGDTIYLTLPIFIEDIKISAPAILLKNYIVYVKSNETFDIYSNISEVKDERENDLRDRLIIDSNYTPGKAGLYQVHYYVTDDENRQSHSLLLIVAED